METKRERRCPTRGIGRPTGRAPGPPLSRLPRQNLEIRLSRRPEEVLRRQRLRTSARRRASLGLCGRSH
eukprot:9224760-Heterocapsa_arctica.AAC.1